MRRLLPALLLALSAAPALAQAPAPAAAPIAAPIAVPRIAYTARTLANGLQVYSARDASSPTVAVHVWYRVGSKDDPEGRSGFAHLFEHLMFKRTAHMADEMMDRLTEDVGGFNNASSLDDLTYYFEVVPSNYLESLLWAEADRMASLVVDSTNFASERDVVKEEFRQGILAPPYGRLFYTIEQNSFTVHPYRRPGIGSIEDLDAATLEDVRRFHRTFYRPDNAVLVVVGDFDQAQFDHWVDRYFGPVTHPDAAVPRVTAVEPARTGERRVSVTAPNAPLPAVALSFLVPSATGADAPALRVAEAVLSGGESSRLYQSLVYTQQAAVQVGVNADLRADAGLLTFYAILAGEKTVEEGEAALLGEIARLQVEPITEAEVDRAKNLLLTAALADRETNNDRAFALAQAVVLYGNADHVNTAIDRLQAVTAADVQRVLAQYLVPTNRLVVHYVPGAEGEMGDGE